MITTALTKMFGLSVPLVLAPMGGVSGGRLAAAVSESGALGLVGGGYGDMPGCAPSSRSFATRRRGRGASASSPGRSTRASSSWCWRMSRTR